MKILLIRDIDKSRIMARDLANNGVEVIIEPVFLIKKLKFNINKFEKNLINTKNKSNLKDFKIAIANHNFGIIITSCNSCEAIIQGGVPLKTKIFSLSKKIANYLENKGFNNILIAREENALSLKNLILEENKNLPKNLPLFYFRGSNITIDFSKDLCKMGFLTGDIICYNVINKNDFSNNFKNFVIKNNLQQEIFESLFIPILSENTAKNFINLLIKNNFSQYFKKSNFLCLSKKIENFILLNGFKNCHLLPVNSITNISDYLKK
jgi:uroporphyrinogen-III synthase